MQKPRQAIDADASETPVLSGIDSISLLQLSGCSRLCTVLGGLGVALSIGGAVATHQLLHEPMESVASASSLHMASAFCTANDTVLARLALAQSSALNLTPGQGTASGAAASPVQVATLILDPKQDRWLQPPPPAIASAISVVGMTTILDSTHASEQGQANGVAQVGPTACADHGLEAVRQQTRVFPLEPRQSERSTSGSPLLYALGPWTTVGGERRLAVALTNLDQLIASVGELDAHGHPGLNHEKTPFTIRTALIDHGQTSAHHQRIEADRQPHHSLIPEDQKLANERWMAYANSHLHTLVTVDHGFIDRTSRRAAALAFVMGLICTMLVVLMSRYSQLKLLDLNQALRHESRTDGLTQLANRRAWDEALLRADQIRMRQSDTYGVVVVDLDGFKQINDIQGHHQGDQVLSQTADALRSAVREADLAARLGGDEFGILLLNPSREGLEEFIHRLQASLDARSIKASIGASLSQAGKTLEATWAEADGSMYQVKQAARIELFTD